jgi:hypothetical protein
MVIDRDVVAVLRVEVEEVADPVGDDDWSGKGIVADEVEGRPLRWWREDLALERGGLGGGMSRSAVVAIAILNAGCPLWRRRWNDLALKRGGVGVEMCGLGVALDRDTAETIAIQKAGWDKAIIVLLWLTGVRL